MFPHTLLFLGGGPNLILLGGREPFDPACLERRFGESPGAARSLSGIGIGEPLPILARITRMDEGLRGDVKGVPAISDQRNDIALLTVDPFDPPLLALDPPAVLRALDAEKLACGERLNVALLNSRRLRAVVPDFPGR